MESFIDRSLAADQPLRMENPLCNWLFLLLYRYEKISLNFSQLFVVSSAEIDSSFPLVAIQFYDFLVWSVDRETKISGGHGRRRWIDHDWIEKKVYIFTIPNLSVCVWEYICRATGSWPWVHRWNVFLRRDMQQGRGCRRLNKRGRSLLPCSFSGPSLFCDWTRRRAGTRKTVEKKKREKSKAAQPQFLKDAATAAEGVFL